MKNNFIAIDFETSYGHIPCSIGIVEFIDGIPTNQYYSLIKPIDLKFSPINSNIHGIYLEDILFEREFDEIWDEISDLICDRIIVAHNSSTDIPILYKTLKHYKIETPNFQSFCTLKMSQIILELNNYKLSSIAKHLNIIQIGHHHALDDALVCGKLFYHFCNSVEDEKYITNIGQYVYKERNTNSAVNAYFDNERVTKTRINYSLCTDIKDRKIEGKTFVVSGVFENFSRDELKKAIEDNGGKSGSSISAKTDYVIAGENMGPAKLEKATKLNVNIISETDFLKMLDERQ